MKSNTLQVCKRQRKHQLKWKKSLFFSTQPYITKQIGAEQSSAWIWGLGGLFCLGQGGYALCLPCGARSRQEVGSKTNSPYPITPWLRQIAPLFHKTTPCFAYGMAWMHMDVGVNTNEFFSRKRADCRTKHPTLPWIAWVGYLLQYSQSGEALFHIHRYCFAECKEAPPLFRFANRLHHFFAKCRHAVSRHARHKRGEPGKRGPRNFWCCSVTQQSTLRRRGCSFLKKDCVAFLKRTADHSVFAYCKADSSAPIHFAKKQCHACLRQGSSIFCSKQRNAKIEFFEQGGIRTPDSVVRSHML